MGREEVNITVDTISLRKIIEKIHTYKDRVCDEIDPEIDMKIDRSDLNGEFIRQSELAAVYGFLYAEAEKEVNRLDFYLSTVYAKLDREVRPELAEKGRVTEKMVENEIISTETYQKVRYELISAKENKRLFKAACDALDHKLQALINAGADHRKSFMDQKALSKDNEKVF